MFMRLVQLSINGEYESSFRQLYTISVLPQLQKMDGCKMADLIKSNSEKGKYISLTFWEDEKQAEKYEKSDAFKNLTAQVNMFLTESSEWKVQLSEDYRLEYKPVLDTPYRKNYSVFANTQNKNIINYEKTGMFTRIVSFKIEQKKIEEFKNIYSSEIIPILEATKGCSFAYLTEGIKDKNEFLSITIWEEKSFADSYENSEKFLEQMEKVRPTLSKFYLWKMNLEQNNKGKIETSEDMKVDNYTIITGKRFN
jgi:heme-degrading monooxygenase HmoA